MKKTIFAFVLALTGGFAVGAPDLSVYYRRNQGIPQFPTTLPATTMNGTILFTPAGTYDIGGPTYGTSDPNRIFCREITYATWRNQNNQVVAFTAEGAGNGLQLRGDESNVAAAVALTFDNRTTLTNALARLGRVKNGGATKSGWDKDGWFGQEAGDGGIRRVPIVNNPGQASGCIDFGTGVALSNGAVDVVFTRDFGAVPSCQCAHVKPTPTPCGVVHDGGTKSIQLVTPDGGSDPVDWHCFGTCGSP